MECAACDCDDNMFFFGVGLDSGEARVYEV